MGSSFEKIAKAINMSKNNVVSTVNSELVRLYWNIGKIIKTDILQNEKAEYGISAVENLSRELVAEYGRGYSSRNLFNMIKFYEVYKDEQILHSLSAKLSWTHIRRLIHIGDDLKREFYMTMAVHERWSVRTLSDRI